MNRKEAKEFLLKELKKVPDRDVLRVATREQLERILVEVDFKTMDDFLMEHNLELSIDEVPKELYIELMCYFSVLPAKSARRKSTPFYGKEIWNFEDASTCEVFFERARRILKTNYSDTFLKQLIKYARSDREDL